MLARLLSSMHMAAGWTFSRCLTACWFELALFIGVALARAGVGRLRVSAFTLGAFPFLLIGAALGPRAAVRHVLDEGELFTVGEGPVVFDAVVHAVVVPRGDVVEFRWLRAFFVDCYV